MRWIEPPGGRPWLLIGLCGASVLLNVILLALLYISPGATEVAESAPPAEAEVQVEPTAEPEVAEAAVAQVAQAQAAMADVQVVEADVVHSLARTFQRAVPEGADAIAAVYARLFWWDMDLRRDLQRGDRIAVAYRTTSEHPEVLWASYERTNGQTLYAVRYHKAGDRYPSYWNKEGLETPRRLKDGPLNDYEQVTALLKDRPSHRGMDFKADEGTPVVSPRSGRITRVNWNRGVNGNCLEIRYDDGTMARMLHLLEVSVESNARVSKGQPIATTGNTGRSTAPHLHYELERGGRILDPLDYHGLERRELSGDELAAFQRFQEALHERQAPVAQEP
jgi:murein DD-endopeptidase MepM/ murein hydrolase activator NlpD